MSRQQQQQQQHKGVPESLNRLKPSIGIMCILSLSHWMSWGESFSLPMPELLQQQKNRLHFKKAALERAAKKSVWFMAVFRNGSHKKYYVRASEREKRTFDVWVKVVWFMNYFWFVVTRASPWHYTYFSSLSTFSAINHKFISAVKSLEKGASDLDQYEGNKKGTNYRRNEAKREEMKDKKRRWRRSNNFKTSTDDHHTQSQKTS
jgi:hypothetical protein